MEPINTVKTITLTLLAVSLGTQNPVGALVNNQIPHSNLASITTKERTNNVEMLHVTSQLNLVAINDTYWGPQRDFEIWMPGRITENTLYQLASVSPTRTVYTIIHKDFPEASRVPIPQIRQVLQSTMRETIGGTGKVVRSTNLVIDGHPGLELLIQHPDGYLGQYRAFVVKQRLYFMGALTQDELSTETANFFDSFRVYPEGISSSR